MGTVSLNGTIGWWLTFSAMGTGGCAPDTGISHCSSCLGWVIAECWRGCSKRLSKNGFKRTSTDSILLVEQWKSSLVYQVKHPLFQWVFDSAKNSRHNHCERSNQFGKHRNASLLSDVVLLASSVCPAGTGAVCNVQ